MFVFGEFLVHFVHQRFIRALRNLQIDAIHKLYTLSLMRWIENPYPTFLIKQIKNTQLRLNEIDARLIVIALNHRPIDILLHVHQLLQLEDMLIELVLQFLICVIDAELLERIQFKRFEAVDIQNADKTVFLLACTAQTPINPIDDVFA